MGKLLYWCSGDTEAAIGAYFLGRPVYDYIKTGEIRHLQEFFIRLAAISTVVGIGGLIGGKLCQISESWALKNTLAQMKVAGIPKEIQYQFLKLYGKAKLDEGIKIFIYFKNYGVSEKALIILYNNFDVKGIALIKNTFMKSAMVYNKNEINAIIILFNIRLYCEPE